LVRRTVVKFHGPVEALAPRPFSVSQLTRQHQDRAALVGQ
jgi:hypothetical protein